MVIKKKSHAGAKAIIGAGLALAAATGYLLSKTTPAERKKFIKKWSAKAKKEVESRYKKAKDLSEVGYKKAVAEVMREYKGVKNIDARELTKLGKELKARWKSVARSFKQGRGKRK